MIQDINDIEARALLLDKSEKMLLVDKLLRSLHDSIDSNIEKAWRTEVKQRKQSLLDGTATLVSEEVVLKSARSVLKK